MKHLKSVEGHKAGDGVVLAEGVGTRRMWVMTQYHLPGLSVSQAPD